MILRIGIVGLTSFNIILGQTATSEGLPAWSEYGVLGLLVVAFLTDLLVSGRKYNAVVKERDDERARTEKAESKIEEKVIPALQQTQAALNLVNEQLLPVLIELRTVLIQSHRDERSRQEGRDVVSEIKRSGRQRGT